jgi:alkanesulfonate monooxygenase SsuD/methylene tetrahydromethanopterin reductase-like flavin-dependent oxidoreductase (luciferase family)
MSIDLAGAQRTERRLSSHLPSDAAFVELCEQARLAQELGYESINASHVDGRDSFTLLSALAVATDKIGLGTSVAPIYQRSPASMAQTAATINSISDGRFRLGLGVGHRVTMREWHGAEIGDPVAEIREYVSIVRAILAGEAAPAGERWRTSFALAKGISRPEVSIRLAALSPKMLQLAGELADGVLLWSCTADYVRDVVVPEVAKGRDHAGKPLAGFEVMPILFAACHEARETVVDTLRDKLHRYFGLPFYRRMFAASGFGEPLAAYDKAAPDRAAQKAAIPETLIDGLSALGTPRDVRAGVERYWAAGATNPVLMSVAGTDFGATLEAAASARTSP